MMKKSKKRKLFHFVSFFAVFLVLSAIVIIGAVSSDNQRYGREAIDFIRVGMVHSEDSVQEYTFTTDNGIEYGIQSKENNSFTALGTCSGKNFTVKSKTGFHSIAVYSYEKNGELIEGVKLQDELKSLMDKEFVPCFEHFSGESGYEVRLGAFETFEECEEYLLKIAVRLEGKLETRMIYEDADTVYLFDENGEVVCGYTGVDTEYALAVNPVKNVLQSDVYLKYGEFIYEGALEFRRYTKGESDGVSVINILPTDRYMACVMSYEISPSSDHEVHRAFAIAVRNYTYHGENKHKSVHFDLCCDTHCQAYRGSGRLNNSIITAVKETAGQVILNDAGELADIYYSSTAGGSTVAVEDTWNTTGQSHLIAFPTPWERYRNYNSYTKWTVEYTPAQLYEKVKDKCTNLKGDIGKVEIQLCEDSPHVYAITYTDIYGNRDTVTGTTTLRMMLGLNSGCFVVGKGGETVKRTVYSYDCFDNVYSPTYEGPLAIKTDKNFLEDVGDQLTEEDIKTLKEYIKEAYGTSSKFMNGVFSISDRGTVMVSAGEESLHFTENGLPDLFSAKVVVKEYEVTLEGESGNFVFDGMGWGHGVGLSQNGLKELVKLGYDYVTILEIYFPGAKVVYVG